jgi:predicted transcriptional regulator
MSTLLTPDVDIPPSARFVAFVLENNGPLSTPEIVDETTLSKSTVHTAVTDLAEAGLVEKRTDPLRPNGQLVVPVAGEDDG